MGRRILTLMDDKKQQIKSNPRKKMSYRSSDTLPLDSIIGIIITPLRLLP